MKNVFKTIILSAFVLLSACGGLEDTVTISETTYKKLDGGGYEVLVDLDCGGGGFLGSDKCEGSRTCMVATFKNAEDEALESVELCKNLTGVGLTTFALREEKDLTSAVLVSLTLDVQNPELSVLDFEEETELALK